MRKTLRFGNHHMQLWATAARAIFGIAALLAMGCGSTAHPPMRETASAPDVASLTTVSPDGKLSVRFQADDRTGSGGACYKVTYSGKVLLKDSPVSLVLEGQSPLAGPFRITHVARSSHDQTYEMAVPTKMRFARDHYNQATIDLEEEGATARKLRLIFRAYDDGIAFRFVIPHQPGLSEFVLTDEHSTFRFAGNPTAYALPLDGYNTPHEAYYHTSPVSGIHKGTLLGLPLLLSFADGPWVAITEADLTNYAGMYLTPDAGSGGAGLVSALAPWPGQSQIKVKGRAPLASPWRVIMVADEPGRLIESNLIENLNPPCALADTSWIHTGKVAFPWWNGYMVPNQPFKGGMNTATMKYYIDFCAANGIEFHSIDGNDVAWYGGPCDRYQGADITKAIPAINMPEVLAYAKKKGVRTRLWVNWAGLRRQMDQALDTYQRWGVDGIMVDFLNRNDQEMVNFVHEVAAKAAARHLTVNFHNLWEPTGMQRTYSNVLNYEGVLNLEYNKWSAGGSVGSTPEHDLTVPFTRMLTGPMDFHSGGMRSVRPSDFKAQWVAPLVMGTRSHELARYVVYENPMPMLADDPAAYRGQVGLDFLRRVPTTWDETHVLAGQVGQFIVIARRHGNEWYLGAMNGNAPRILTLPVTFLGPGTFKAQTYADDPRPGSRPTSVMRISRTVTRSDMIRLNLSVAGGQATRFVPAQ